MQTLIPRLVSLIFVASLLPALSFAQAGVTQSASSNPFNIQQPINLPYVWTDNPSAPGSPGRLRHHDSDHLRYHITFFPTETGIIQPVAAKKMLHLEQHAAPKEAAPFIGEPFYPHLATLLVHEEISNGLKKRLNKYRERRDQAARDIKNQISKTAGLSPAESAASWIAFNTQNTASWKKLEKERESLWGRLQHGGTWSPGVELYDILQLARSIHQEKPNVAVLPVRVLQYFGPGLSLAQRDLLGQVAIDLNMRPQLLPDSSLLISATGKRLSLPEEPAESVETALANYEATKKQLQNELLDELLPFVQRTNWKFEKFEHVAKRLQDQQESRFVQLDQQFNELVQAVKRERKATANDDLSLPDSESIKDLQSLAVLTSPQRRLLASSSLRSL